MLTRAYGAFVIDDIFCWTSRDSRTRYITASRAIHFLHLRLPQNPNDPGAIQSFQELGAAYAS